MNKNTASTLSFVAIASGAVSLVSLALLHFLSSYMDPSWHMVSEYAFGNYGWLLSIFFFAWAISYWATGLALIPYAKNIFSKIFIFFLLVSGVGALMGGLFDVRESLHGLAFALGVPFLPLAAPFFTYYIQRNYKVKNTFTVITAHLSWISFILMAVTMGMFMSQMQQAGALDYNAVPQYMSSLPEGVSTIIGYANRLLVLSYLGWLISVNILLLNVFKKK